MYPWSWLLKTVIFFIPGALFLLSIYGIFPEVKGVVLHVWNGYKITGLILMGGVCFIAAGLIDFLWATLTSLVQWIQSFGKRSASFFEKLKIFDSLTVRTYKYRYPIFNFSLSILVVWGLARLKESDSIFWTAFGSSWIPPVVVVALVILTWVISYRKAYWAIFRVKKTSQSNRKREGDTSCVKKCHPKDHPPTR